MEKLTLIQTIAVAVLPVLFAITLHEVAHGWAAQRLGDDTAARLGRLSVNPIRHIDPVGTLIIPGLLLLVNAPILFGWAKPVPVDFSRLRDPRRDMALVALAGPAANLMMALFWTLVIRLAAAADIGGVTEPLKLMGQYGISINVMLALLNMLPIPPLDGGRVAVGLLPYNWAVIFSRVEPYGFFILVGLVFSKLLDSILGFPVRFVETMFYSLAGF